MSRTGWAAGIFGLAGVLLGLLCAARVGSAEAAYKYFRVGAASDLVTDPEAGYALMGGGTDLDEAFQWLCGRAHGGDFLILRAAGGDDYNPYVQKLCRVNSVATLIVPSREAASDPFVKETIAHAEAIFIAGGDQANYIRFWTGTPVQAGINDAIRRGVPVGGTSAGLAVMGEWAFTAEGDKPDDPNLSSKLALADPMGPRVTLVRGFLGAPVLKGIITDSHFARRDRMGRLLVFLARIHAMDPKQRIRGIGVEQGAAVLVEPDGRGRTVGAGCAYFVEEKAGVSVRTGLPGLHADVWRAAPGQPFDLKAWTGDGAGYVLTTDDGRLRSSQSRGTLY